MMRLLIFIPLLALAGCYGSKKAQRQLARATSTFPILGAAYCAKAFPIEVDTVLMGGTIIDDDTIYLDAYILERDTTYLTDTIKITETKIKEKYINRTVTRVDTIVKENTAKLEVCAQERSQAISLLDKKTKESDDWEKKARSRFWILAGIGAAGLIWLFFFIRRKVTKQIPIQ